MQKFKRVILTLIMAVLSLPALYWLLSEAAVLYEMASTGAKTRAELGDDFGLGFLGLFLVLPGTVIGAVVVGLLTWFLSRRMETKKDKNA